MNLKISTLLILLVTVSGSIALSQQSEKSQRVAKLLKVSGREVRIKKGYSEFYRRSFESVPLEIRRSNLDVMKMGSVKGHDELVSAAYLRMVSNLANQMSDDEIAALTAYYSSPAGQTHAQFDTQYEKAFQDSFKVNEDKMKLLKSALKPH